MKGRREEEDGNLVMQDTKRERLEREEGVLVSREREMDGATEGNERRREEKMEREKKRGGLTSFRLQTHFRPSSLPLTLSACSASSLVPSFSLFCLPMDRPSDQTRDSG